ncbi:MAG: SRPBCC family protein [Salinibacterium sp.]|nr:SRPBCC family protein [Salinibacterium sp.]
MAGSSATTVATAMGTPKEAYDIAGPVDPTKFYPKSGVLPAVVEVRNQTGTWDTVGHTRMLILSDGGHVIETITDADSPGYFAYELTDFQKLFGTLVDHARAEWRFDPVSDGTSIRWTYTFFGKPGRGWIVGLIVGLLWTPYMRKVLPPIANEVTRQVAAKGKG